MCGELDTDDLHVYWTCPRLVLSDDEDIKDTQHLVPAATAGSLEYPCLWLRGCLPLGFDEIGTLRVEEEAF